MKLPTYLLAAVFSMFLMVGGGCKSVQKVEEEVAPKEVPVASGKTPLRAGPNLQGRVYRPGPDGWKLSDEDVKIPEGWWVIPPHMIRVHP